MTEIMFCALTCTQQTPRLSHGHIHDAQKHTLPLDPEEPNPKYFQRSDIRAMTEIMFCALCMHTNNTVFEPWTHPPRTKTHTPLGPEEPNTKYLQR